MITINEAREHVASKPFVSRTENRDIFLCKPSPSKEKNHSEIQKDRIRYSRQMQKKVDEVFKNTGSLWSQEEGTYKLFLDNELVPDERLGVKEVLLGSAGLILSEGISDLVDDSRNGEKNSRIYIEFGLQRSLVFSMSRKHNLFVPQGSSDELIVSTGG